MIPKKRTKLELELVTQEAKLQSPIHRAITDTFVGYCFSAVGIKSNKIVKFLDCRAVATEEETLAMVRLWDSNGELIVMSECTHPYGNEAIAGAFKQIADGLG